MGMDVVGTKPRTEEGKYFRSSIWSWRPLALYVCSVAPEITSKCKEWQTNDGYGLDEIDSINLASVLQREIDTGRTEQYARIRKSEIERMPNEVCKLCEGTGTRNPPPTSGAGNPKTDGVPCNGCDATGYRRPWAASYPFHVGHVQEFATFLRGSGGFKIY